MTDKLNESIERWRVPISIGTMIAILVFVVVSTRALTQDRAEIVGQLHSCQVEILKLKESSEGLWAAENQKNVALAEIRKDLTYIRLVLEKMERREIQ
jgi:hypothetical protein